MAVFLDWFKYCFLPHAKGLPGPKVLIGDNLSSHFSVEVLKLCSENDIHFDCLPPNSTHLMQPLDVSFFALLKRVWRHIIGSWKQRNPREKTVQKEVFPEMLKECLAQLAPNIEQNLKSGFKACGIFPLDPTAVLDKLPQKDPDVEAALDLALAL